MYSGCPSNSYWLVRDPPNTPQWLPQSQVDLRTCHWQEYGGCVYLIILAYTVLMHLLDLIPRPAEQPVCVYTNGSCKPGLSLQAQMGMANQPAKLRFFLVSRSKWSIINDMIFMPGEPRHWTG